MGDFPSALFFFLMKAWTIILGTARIQHMRLKRFSPNFVVVFILMVLVAGLFSAGYQFYQKFIHEKKVLQEIIRRLQADSRIAEVIVSAVGYDETSKKPTTTIKFLELDSQGRSLPAKYFTFQGNIIQFQSLVVRFDDALVTSGDSLRGKSVYLFWKVFALDGKNTQEYTITPIDEIPAGYKVDSAESAFEKRLWAEFWDYALYSKAATSQRVKNAQIEAPGKKFVPGILYTLRIEHDGGMRIDTSEIPEILKGERVP